MADASPNCDAEVIAQFLAAFVMLIDSESAQNLEFWAERDMVDCRSADFLDQAVRTSRQSAKCFG